MNGLKGFQNYFKAYSKESYRKVGHFAARNTTYQKTSGAGKGTSKKVVSQFQEKRLFKTGGNRNDEGKYSGYVSRVFLEDV